MYKLLLILILSTLFIGCANNNDTNNSQAIVYLEVPTVNASVDAIYVKFNSTLNSDTVENRSVYLLDENRNVVDVDLKVLYYTNEILLTPYKYLPVLAQYRVVITTGVQDINNHYLKNNYEYPFITKKSLPRLTDLKTAVAEDVKYGATIGQIDIRTTGDNHISSIDLKGVGHKLFQVSTSGYISLTKDSSLDFETDSSYTLTAIATNSIGQSDPVTVDINVTNVAEIVPTLIDSNATVAEDAHKWAEVGFVKIDNSGDHYILSMKLDGDGSKNFTVAPDGKITVAEGAQLDYETIKSYDLTVSAANGAGDSESVALHIEVTDIDTVATLDNFRGSVKENSLTQTIVGTMKIISDGDNEITEISLSGYGHENFEVTKEGIIKVADDADIDFEKKDRYALYAIAKNSAGDSERVDVKISVDNVEDPFLIAKIQADDGQREDNYGKSIAVSGDYTVVGASNEDSTAENSGAVYLYKKNSLGELTQIAKLKADDAEENDYFGYSVAIDGDYIVVGAYKEDTNENNAGSVYIFKRKSDDTNDTKQIAKIQADSPQEDAKFGNAVSISGRYIAVGSSYDNFDTEDDAGSVYLFKRNSDSKDDVSQIAQLNASNYGKEDWFGHSVAIDGDYIIVGAYGEDTKGDNAGAIYLFKRNSDDDDDTKQIAMIVINHAHDFDYLGYSVAISGNYILTATHGDDSSAENAGMAYLFERKSDDEDDVKLISKFEAKEPHPYDYFGRSVSMNGVYMLIGASYEDTDKESNSGSAYLFRRDFTQKNNVKQVKKLQSREVLEDEYFGYSVALNGDNIAIATHKQNGKVFSYIFDIEPLDKVYLYNSIETEYEEQFSRKFVKTFDGESPSSDKITYTLDGTDADLLDFKNNKLSFNTVPDYEKPQDGGRDNSYKIKIIATDEYNQTTSKNIKLLVQNRYFLYASKIQSKKPKADDAFAQSVSVSGDYMAVGVPFNDDVALGGGTAYLFKKDSDGKLQQIAKFRADDVQENDNFGHSISIDGDYIIVGAPNEDTSAENGGTVYLFKRKSDDKNDVRQIAKIDADDTKENDLFGYSVSISGNYIAVGAYQEDSKADNAGSAYLFRRDSDDNNDISQIEKLQADDAKANDYFGYSVGISGNYIAVGAYQNEEDDSDTNTGSAYLFKRKTDNDVPLIAEFEADDKADYDYFAKSIAIDGDYIIVGAYNEDFNDINNSGSAYLFKRDSDDDNDTNQIAKISADDASENDWFGYSVDISGDFITVGAYKKDTTAEDTGKVYIYERKSDDKDDVKQVDSIKGFDSQKGDFFEYAVSIDEDKVGVGAFREDSTKENAESAYFFIKDVNEGE